MSDELDMIPLYAEALSFPTKLYDSIDRIYYGELKYEFYQEAKKSKYYDCFLCGSHSILRESYYKKVIGILEYYDQHEDQNLQQEIYDLFKKGFNKCYKFFIGRKSLEDYNDFIVFFHDRILKENMSDEELFCYYIASIFFTNTITPFAKCKNTEKVMEILIQAWKFYMLGEKRLDIKKINSGIISNIRKNIPIKIDLNNYIHRSMSASEDPYAFLYDLEGISSLGIFEEIQFSKKDEDAVLYIYDALYKSDNKIEIDNFAIPAAQIIALLRAYKNAKKLYFENNKDSMLSEIKHKQDIISEVQADLQKEKIELEKLKLQTQEEVDALKKECSRLKKENTNMKKEISSMISDSKEIVALRNYAYSKNKVDITEEKDMVDVKGIDDISGVIIGGHPIWQTKLKEKLPKWKFIGVDVTLNEDVICNAPVVLFNVSYIGHSLYNKAMALIRAHSIKLGYIGSTNIELCLKEIENIV